MIERHASPIVVLTCRWVARLIQIFAFYVIFHGHYSPGGGFQGGALLAASILLLRLSEGKRETQDEFNSKLGTPLGAVGALVYAGIGLAAVIGGGQFLNYSFVHLPGIHEESGLHSLNILIIETGVGLAVMATLISIFDTLTEGNGDD